MAFSRTLLAAALLFSVSAHATDLYTQDNNWSSLASDRNARKAGDLLTIVVYESSDATNTASSNAKKSSKLGGRVSAGSNFDESGSLSLDNDSDNSGSTGRSGRMVAQISAVVDEVLPNGDLRVSGAQVLNINGEETNIRVRGRVRQADISSSNAVLSSRLADAAIDYDGSGFVSRSSQPGVVSRVFSWLGVP